MAFSFSNWFKKPTGNEPANESAPDAAPESVATATAAPPEPPAPLARPAPIPAPAPPGSASVPPRTPTRPIKTAMPNSVRPMSLHEGARPASATPPASSLPSSVSLRNSPTTAPAPRTISFPGAAATAIPTTVRMPAAAPAPPPAAAPAPNAAITLTLGDFVDRIPANLLKAGAPVDRHRNVVFRAADLYSDLSRGRAAVPVSTIQSVCPDLFSRPVSETEDVEVPLPLPKLVEQLGAALQTRTDQLAADDVAEIETPFLQVALEDGVRLPKPPPSAPPRPHIAAIAPAAAPARRPADPAIAPTPGSPSIANAATPAEVATVRPQTPRPVHINPVRQPGAEPAPVTSLTATPGTGISAPTQSTVAPINASAKRPPSTVRASVAGGKIRLSGPAISSRSVAPVVHPATVAPPPALKPILVPAAPLPAGASSLPAQKKTARIQIPAIALRAGGAPIAAPAMPPRPAGPTASPGKPSAYPEPPVSFRASPGLVELTPSAPVVPPPPAAAAVPAPSAGAAPSPMPMISLALGPILRSLPVTMFAAGLDGNAAAESVPDDVRVQLPLLFVTSQLAQGRVAVAREEFVAAMPEAYRPLLPAEGEPTEVLIPLQEVFQSLPTGALNRREDQLVEEVGPEIPTPFSAKAQEDAARLQAEAAPAAALAEPLFMEEPPAAEAPVEITEPKPPVVEPHALIPAVPGAEGLPGLLASPTQVDENLAPKETLSDLAAAPAGAATEQPQVETVAATHGSENAPHFLSETATPQEAIELPAPAAHEVHPPVTPDPSPTDLEVVPEPKIATAPDVSEPAIHAEVAPTSHALEGAPTPAGEVEPTPEHREPEAAPLNLPPSLSTETEPTPVSRVSPPDAFPTEHPAHEAEPAAAPSVLNGSGRPTPPGRSAPASVEEAQEALRAIFMVDEDLDAKKVVKLVSSLPGLKACAVMFADGLKLAGGLESVSSGEGFCAMTPPFFRRVGNYTRELNLGEIQCVTLQTERALLSFFMQGDICLSVQHASNRGFLPGVREKLLNATGELARMYALPAAHH